MTDIDTILKERYASRFDYIRTMCALMKGAGLDADIVFAANDFTDGAKVKSYNYEKYPNVEKYSLPICRVRVKYGSILGFGGEVQEYFIGTENEYTPIFASSVNGSTYLDLASKNPVDLSVEKRVNAFDDTVQKSYTIYVRENGAVDIDYKEKASGILAGVFRKLYSEMLPEDRSRHFQKMLGSLAQAATATRELITDIDKGELSFSAYIPNFATLSGDTMTISLPEIGFAFSSLTGNVRESPIYISGSKASENIEVKVVFPEGYTEVEHLPTQLCELLKYGYNLKVENVEKDLKDRLVVNVSESMCARVDNKFEPLEFAALKDFSRVASSRANRTIIVRKKGR
jgi:hypothetical protein